MLSSPPRSRLRWVGLVLAALATTALAEEKSDLHLTGGSVSGTHRMDAKGYTWDIRTDSGTVYHATNYLYSNGKYLYVQGNNFGGQGNARQFGDEIETGPWNFHGLRVYRRVKIFKKDGVARWLDIFENPGSGDISANIRLQSHFNYGIQSLKTSSGDGTWDEKDFAAVIDTQRNNNTPSVLHVMCGPKAKVRPSVNQQGNVLQTEYNLTIPAGKTVVIAHFAVQDHSTGTLQKAMKSFKPADYLRDLKPAVRKLIINVQMSGLTLIELERSGKADVVMLRTGDPVFGTIANSEFVINSTFGKLTLPAEDVIGMAAKPHERGVFQAVLADGQLVCGTLEEQKIALSVPAAGEQHIPFNDIAQWSYQITGERPEEVPFNGPQLLMRSGDRLAFEPDSVALKLRTRCGVVDLQADALHSINLDTPDHGVHRVKFLNGSILAGMLEPASFEVELRLNAKRTIQRNAVHSILYALEESRPTPLTRVDLTNGDHLYGRFAEETLTIEGKYGPVTVKPTNMLAMQTLPSQKGWVRLTMWNGSVLIGKLSQETLTFQIEPGPAVTLRPAQIAAAARPDALPPEEVLKTVEQLVARLAAENFEDRDRAQKALVEMGPSILPLLKDHVAGKDPEVKRRLETIIEELSPAGARLPADETTIPQPQILIGG